MGLVVALSIGSASPAHFAADRILVTGPVMLQPSTARVLLLFAWPVFSAHVCVGKHWSPGALVLFCWWSFHLARSRLTCDGAFRRYATFRHASLVSCLWPPENLSLTTILDVLSSNICQDNNWLSHNNVFRRLSKNRHIRDRHDPRLVSITGNNPIYYESYRIVSGFVFDIHTREYINGAGVFSIRSQS